MVLDFFRFMQASAGAMTRGGRNYYLWLLFLVGVDCPGRAGVPAPAARGPRRHEHGRPGAVGRLHRELHVSRRDGGCGGDARDPRVRLRRPRAARGRGAGRAHGRVGAGDVPGVRDGRHRAARPVLASGAGPRPLQLAGVDALVGRHRPQRVPGCSTSTSRRTSLFTKFRGRKPDRKKYVPFVFLAIGWAISIHTVTAFLYSGMGARPHWNAAILAPRFLASAFAAGPSMVIVAFSVVRDRMGFPVKDEGDEPSAPDCRRRR